MGKDTYDGNHPPHVVRFGAGKEKVLEQRVGHDALHVEVYQFKVEIRVRPTSRDGHEWATQTRIG